MKVLVIGSGLIGITTAWMLRARGHEVTVVDRQDGPGKDTSFANAGLLTPSMSDPWNSPECWRSLLASIYRSDTALQLRVRALPSISRWGVQFLRNSNAVTSERSALHNLRLALHSLRAMRSLRTETRIEYTHSAPGSLRIFRDPSALDEATRIAERRTSEGLIFRRLSPAEVAQLEPCLAPIIGQLAGAVHYPVDEIGDAYQFCVGLAKNAQLKGVRFAMAHEVRMLTLQSGLVAEAYADAFSDDGRTSPQRFTADCYVIAAGSYSAPLGRPLGLAIPVSPAKGYSVTLNASAEASQLSIPLIDDSWHAAIVPIGKAIRVAGTAEFAGFDRSLRPERVQNLIDMANQVLPRARLTLTDSKQWCGLRALSVDGVPIIGPTKIPNLFVNTGHGHLGWTLAAGSSELLCATICGDTPPVDPTPYSIRRFS